MKFDKFVSKLLPSFGKRKLISELDQIRDKLKTCTLPVYNTIVSNGKGKDLKSEQAKHFESIYQKKVKRGNMYVGIQDTLKNALEMCDYLEDQIENKFANDITRSTVNAYMVNILKLMEGIDFISDYSRALALYLTNTSINTKNGVDQLEGITKADIDFITSYKYSYMDGLAILEKAPKEIQAKLEAIPEITITEDNLNSVNSTIGANKVDPLKLNFFSPKYNPSMFFVTRIARYQANKYKQAQMDLQEVQAKLMKLKRQQLDQSDAKLDKQIEYYENVNNRLKDQIEQMEEDYELR